MKPEPNTLYKCLTQEASDAFLRDCDAQGIIWEDGDTASSYDGWKEYADDTCYRVFKSGDRVCISYSHVDDYFNIYSDDPVVVCPDISDEEQAVIDNAWKK